MHYIWPALYWFPLACSYIETPMRIFLCMVLQFITTLDYRWANEIEDTTSMKNSLVQIPLILTPFRYSEGWTVHFRSYSHVPRYPYAPPHGSPNLLPHIVQHPHVSKTSWASGQDSCTSVTFSHLPVSHPSHPRSGAVQWWTGDGGHAPSPQRAGH